MKRLLDTRVQKRVSALLNYDSTDDYIIGVLTDEEFNLSKGTAKTVLELIKREKRARETSKEVPPQLGRD
jgi:hypothetical protein